ncbi:hypothetical protein LTR35_003532 [Friedmanniomyces endolithicus]|nr:hypothetical protein LTR35_003532 [Friedmanniomyces endolithicus]KAK0294030.1 hypothetical protein LTS00_007369 [Friedmanniomyces endolithicus]
MSPPQPSTSIRAHLCGRRHSVNLHLSPHDPNTTTIENALLRHFGVDERSFRHTLLWHFRAEACQVQRPFADLGRMAGTVPEILRRESLRVHVCRAVGLVPGPGYAAVGGGVVGGVAAGPAVASSGESGGGGARAGGAGEVLGGGTIVPGQARTEHLDGETEAPGDETGVSGDRTKTVGQGRVVSGGEGPVTSAEVATAGRATTGSDEEATTSNADTIAPGESAGVIDEDAGSGAGADADEAAEQRCNHAVHAGSSNTAANSSSSEGDGSPSQSAADNSSEPPSPRPSPPSSDNSATVADEVAFHLKWSPETCQQLGRTPHTFSNIRTQLDDDLVGIRERIRDDIVRVLQLILQQFPQVRDLFRDTIAIRYRAVVGIVTGGHDVVDLEDASYGGRFTDVSDLFVDPTTAPLSVNVAVTLLLDDGSDSSPAAKKRKMSKISTETPEFDQLVRSTQDDANPRRRLVRLGEVSERELSEPDDIAEEFPILAEIDREQRTLIFLWETRAWSFDDFCIGGFELSKKTLRFSQRLLPDLRTSDYRCTDAFPAATIECLIAYTAGLRSNNAFVNVWLMLGLIVRLALRMGYHRDAKHYPNITPFHGEMRRRAWAGISMIDVLISFQLGLPSMVKTIQSDTQPPRNLLDRDFGITTTVLPPSRGEHELTPSSYTRAKLGLTRIFANAAELSHATLEEAKRAIPPLLQMPDISELVTDPAEQLMCRFNLDLLYLKTKMVLHRRFVLTPLAQLSADEQKLGIGRSRKVCVESALRVLQHHHTIYTASQPGGQLESVKWYMGSISTHDFLLAAMLVCLELSTHIQPDLYLLVNPSGHRCPIRGELIEALEKSQRIWMESARSRTCGFVASSANGKGEQMFDETERAARAMGIMVQKVRAQFGARGVVGAGEGESEGGESREGGRKGKELEVGTPFMGVVSNYDWGSMAGVPEMLEDSTLSAGYTNGVGSVDAATSGPAAYDIDEDFMNSSLGHDGDSISFDPRDPSLNVDFSIIGDMLDLTGPEMNMDWETWDSQMNSAQQVHASSQDWPDPQLAGLEPSASAKEFGDARWGLGVVGNSGTIHGSTFPTGTGPLNPNLWPTGMNASATAAAVGGSGAPRGPGTIAWDGGVENIWGNIWGIDFGTEDSGADAIGGRESMGGMEFGR